MVIKMKTINVDDVCIKIYDDENMTIAHSQNTEYPKSMLKRIIKEHAGAHLKSLRFKLKEIQPQSTYYEVVYY